MSSLTDLPLCHLSSANTDARAWCDMLAYDELQPLAKDGSRPDKKLYAKLVAASYGASNGDHKRFTRQLRTTQELMAYMPRQVMPIEMPKTVLYRHWSQPIERSCRHGIIVHAGATLDCPTDVSIAYLVLPPYAASSETVPEGFFPLFSRIVPIPLKPSWATWIWELCHHREWITPCPGYHSSVLRIEPYMPELATEISQAIAARLLL